MRAEVAGQSCPENLSSATWGNLRILEDCYTTKDRKFPLFVSPLAHLNAWSPVQIILRESSSPSCNDSLIRGRCYTIHFLRARIVEKIWQHLQQSLLSIEAVK